MHNKAVKLRVSVQDKLISTFFGLETVGEKEITTNRITIMRSRKQ